MRNRKMKHEQFSMFKILHFVPILPSPQMKTHGYMQDQSQLSAGTEVIRNNASHTEVMQQDLH